MLEAPICREGGMEDEGGREDEGGMEDDEAAIGSRGRRSVLEQQSGYWVRSSVAEESVVRQEYLKFEERLHERSAEKEGPTLVHEGWEVWASEERQRNDLEWRALGLDGTEVWHKLYLESEPPYLMHVNTLTRTCVSAWKRRSLGTGGHIE